MTGQNKQPKAKEPGKKMVLVAIPIDLYRDFQGSKLRKQSTTDTAAILAAVRDSIKSDAATQINS